MGELNSKRSEDQSVSSLFADQSRPKALDEMTKEDLFNEGDAKLKASEDAVDRMHKRVNEGIDLGNAINAELLSQREKIEGMTNKVKDTQSVLKRTNELLKYFGRQVVTDKILMCLLFLIVVVIAVIAYLKFSGKGRIPTISDLKGKDDTTTQTPTTTTSAFLSAIGMTY
eukprot:TRINITY_DN7939_c0_g1_i4.p1 TRINITY_DN7939_c0_g1~~TRINITY_DN7939_c0_g1_i4.p1  ORF type:complete len:170 (-),score=45.35 TRINITY_DN7939_c0_g1_i4:94-603(-)